MGSKKDKDKNVNKELIEKLRRGETGIIDDPEEELEVLEAYERGELAHVENVEAKKRELVDAAGKTSLKTKRISIRVVEDDLEKLKVKAAESGIPYQTLLGSLIHQYVTGKVSLLI